MLRAGESESIQCGAGFSERKSFLAVRPERELYRIVDENSVLASLRFLFAKIGVERYWDATPLKGDGLVCCVSKNRLAEHAG